MIDIPTRVRVALKEGSYRKNWRFSILKDDGTTDFVIDNDYLVSESVNYDERMCSATKLKFGLCEGTNLDFQYFDKPNITGRHLKAEIGCEYEDADGKIKTYYIPMGFFDVDECSRQASTGIIKASCYNKLLSDYLDSNLTTQIKQIVATGEDEVTGSASIQHILDILLEGYSIETVEESESTFHPSKTFWGYQIYSTPGMKVVGTSNYIHPIGAKCYLDIDNATTSDYFRIEILVQALRNKFKTWCPYLNSTVLVQDETIKIENFINNGYTNRAEDNYSQCSCGYYEIDSVAIAGSADTGYYNKPIVKKDFSKVNEIKTDYMTNLNVSGSYPHPIIISVPVMWIQNTSGDSYNPTTAQATTCKSRFDEIVNSIEQYINVYMKKLSELEKYKITSSSVASLTGGITLRELQSAVFEQQAQFGKLDRETDLFSGVNLNSSRLYPSETLYPANDLYPLSTAESADKAMYSRLWGDEGNVHNFKYLIITYKGTDGEDHTLQRTVNADGTDNYNMSDNWLFRNLSWSATDVGKYADEMVNLLKDVSWFPFEMWCAGLPYVETGDEIEISIGGNTYTTYVLERTLKGIQNLQDEYINGSLNIF